MTVNKPIFCTPGSSNTLFGSISDATVDDMAELLGVIRSQISVVPQPYPEREFRAQSGPYEGGERPSGASGTLLGARRETR
jgi:hypothetical protein